MAATCSGVDPQQPPTIRAPCSTYPATCSASISGPASYTTLAPTICGTPALGFTQTGTSPAASRISATTRSASASDRPQFVPTAAMPNGTTAATASAGLSPIIVLVPMSNENDTTSGKLVELWIPSTAQI